MKVRVLYPQAFAGIVDEMPRAGSVVDVDEASARGLIAAGEAESPDVKPPVEQATAAPGEQRREILRKRG